MGKIKILVADSHPVVRLGVKAILSGVEDVVVVDEAWDGRELLDTVGKKDYDVIIFEIFRPAGNGLDLLRKLRKNFPKAAILIFTLLPEDQFAVRALKMGAAGYLSKQSEPEEFIGAIHKIAQGKKYISPDLAELLADTLNLDFDKPIHEKISDREYQVLALMASGKRLKEIANILSLSLRTVDICQKSICTKMKINSKSELIRYAIKNNLVGDSEDRSFPSLE
jgi:two-component system, NarL family, invasion response regulator UvrY